MGEPLEQVAIDSSPEPFWTVPNLLSLVRILLIGPTIWLLREGSDFRLEVLALILVMVGTDVLDGFVARLQGDVTRLGKVLDPVADKLAIDLIAVFLVPLKGLPSWVAVLVIGRDVLIVLAGIFLIAQRGIVLGSNFCGKVTSVILTMLILSYLMDLDILNFPLVLMGVAMLGF